MAKPSAFAKLKSVDSMPPAEPEGRVHHKERQTQRQANRIGKKTVIFYELPEAVRELKRLAVDQDRTMQNLMQEALDDLLMKYGKHAFGKR